MIEVLFPCKSFSLSAILLYVCFYSHTYAWVCVLWVCLEECTEVKWHQVVCIFRAISATAVGQSRSLLAESQRKYRNVSVTDVLAAEQFGNFLSQTVQTLKEQRNAQSVILFQRRRKLKQNKFLVFSFTHCVWNATVTVFWLNFGNWHADCR